MISQIKLPYSYDLISLFEPIGDLRHGVDHDARTHFTQICMVRAIDHKNLALFA